MPRLAARETGITPVAGVGSQTKSLLGPSAHRRGFSIYALLLCTQNGIFRDRPQTTPFVRTPDLSIIIVSYNTCSDLRECLWSIRRLHDEADIEVIVVDNHSPDASAEMVKSEFPEAHLLEQSENRGFAAGVNAGVRVASGSYLFILNPDTVVPRGAIRGMLTQAKNSADAGILGYSLMDMTGQCQPSTFKFPSLFREFWNMIPEMKALVPSVSRGRLRRPSQEEQRSDALQSTDIREVESISGAAFMIKRDTMISLGGMDEGFFLYHEEIDLCTRIRRMGGKVYSIPHLYIIHRDARSTGFRKNRLPRNPVLTWRLMGMNRLWRKHRSPAMADAWLRQSTALLSIRIILLKLSRIVRDRDSSELTTSRIGELQELIRKLHSIRTEKAG